MKRTLLKLAALALLVATPLVSVAATAGLPDFTSIVEKYGPTVVNVRADITQPSPFSRGPGGQQQAQVPDIFRFFGFPVPPPQQMQPEEEISMGSGFIISPDGYILTNDHVVDGAKKISVTLADHREFTAKLVGADTTYDIALLKINAQNLPTVAIGNSNALKPGQWVLAIGSPFGFDHTVTAGIVSAVSRSFGPEDQQFTPFIQTDVPINRGNSGGPLFNMDGQVIGINSQIFSNTGGYMGVSFAIPIDVAMNAVQQLKTKGYVERGMIGVTMQPVTRNTAKALGMSRVEGGLVASVEPGSPAAKAGIKPGDVIVAYDGKTINSVKDLPPMVGMTPPGSIARVTVVRFGKTLNLNVKVEQAPRGKNALAKMEQAISGNGLGLSVKDLSAGQRQQLGLKVGEGVQISTASGPSRDAGLQPGDVILMVGQERVGSVTQFESAVRAYKPGQVAILLVRRGQVSQFVAVPVPRPGAGKQ
ncbi:MAG: DegQ family serine endoprotease [Metallibacterium sp.]